MTSVQICGYAFVFGSIRDDGEPPMFIAPSAFMLDGFRVPFRAYHDASHPGFANSADGTLTLTQDDYGLRLRATVDLDRCRYVIQGIECGRHNGLSIVLPANRISHREGDVEVVTRTTVDEISVVTIPACRGAYCWTAGFLREGMPAAARDTRRRYDFEEQRAKLVHQQAEPPRIAAHASWKMPVPPSVTALLNSPWWPSSAVWK